jgi:hypothetical protein
MMRVYKYTLGIEDEQKVRMPIGAKVLSVQMQDDVLCVWALVNPDAGREYRRFFIHGTGHVVRYPDEALFVGTVHLPEHGLVFHIFVLPEGE